MIHRLFVWHKDTKKILYSEKVHSQVEYLCCLFDLVAAVKDFPNVEIAYVAPEPIIGRSRSKTFRHEEIVELAQAIKKGGEHNGFQKSGRNPR